MPSSVARVLAIEVGIRDVELALILAVVLVLSVALVVREVRRNARAQRALASSSLEVTLRPPWAGSSPDAAAQKPGVWSAWYRDGTLACHVCTQAQVADRQLGEPVSIVGAELRIVQGSSWEPAILSRKSIAVPGGIPTLLEIDEYVSIDSQQAPTNAWLVLTLDLAHRSRTVERRLCPVEVRFAASGVETPPHP